MAIDVTWTYFLTLFVVAIGSSFQFYSAGVVNPPQLIVETWVNQTYFERYGSGLDESGLLLLWSMIASSLLMGCFLGCILTRTMAEYYGRRNSLILIGLVSLLGGVCELICKAVGSPELLIIGRILFGISMGIGSGVAPMYMMEISPVSYRGAAGTVHMIAVAFGDWFSLLLGQPTILGSERLWPVAFAIPALPALLLVIMLPFLPKSPRYSLMSRGNREEAYKAIEFFTAPEGVQEAFEALVRAAALEQGAGSFHMTDLLRAKHLRLPSLIAIAVMFGQQFSGVAAIFMYSTNIFIQARATAVQAQYATLGLGVCYFICTLPSPYLIERLGRRFLSLMQLIGCTVALVFLSVFMGLQLYASVGLWASFGTIAALLVFMAFYGVGSPVAWMITGELFAQEHRSAAVTLSTFVSWLLSFIVSIGYLPFQQAVGPALSFLPFIVVLCFVTVILTALLPETKNRAIDDIVAEFRHRTRTLSEAVRAPTRKLTRRGRVAGTETQSILEENQSIAEENGMENGAVPSETDNLRNHGKTNYGAINDDQ